jgi:DNA-binding NarL/FixJ family response regulator
MQRMTDLKSRCSMPRVLIVDDHSIVRLGLRTFFRDEAPTYVIGEAASGPEAVEQCQSVTWDIVLLDISLPGMSGHEVLRHLLAAYPGLPVVMLSFFIEHDHVRQCLDAGALGYVAKDELPEQILPAIVAALAGHTYISPAVRALLNNGDVDAAAPSFEPS